MIRRDPTIQHGRPVVRGPRPPVEQARAAVLPGVTPPGAWPPTIDEARIGWEATGTPAWQADELRAPRRRVAS